MPTTKLDSAKNSPEASLRDFIESNKQVPITRWIVTSCQFILAASCFAAMEFFDSELFALTEYFARRDIEASEAVLFVPGSGFFDIFLLFGLILVLCNLVENFLTLDNRILASVLAVDEEATITKLSLLAKSNGLVLSGKDYARRLVVKKTSIFGLIGIGLLATAALSWVIEAHNYTLITLDGVTKVKGLSRKPRVFTPWSTATEYRLGCQYIANAKRGPKNFAIMAIQASDKKIVDLGSTKPMSGDWLDNMEKIDEKLNAVPVKRVDGNGYFSTESVENCLSAFQETFGQRDFERFKRLITP
jgi:hypothetical protein